jgi:regulator of protease activity HflC (stomatin/prohibitin superfamily)
MRSSSSFSGLLFFICVATGLTIGLLSLSKEGGNSPLTVVIPLTIGSLLGIFLANGVRVVAAWERMVVLRLGRFQSVREPGLRLLLPVIDSPIYVEMRLQTVDIKKQQAITQDNVPVMVNGVIFFKVTEPDSAALKVENYRYSVNRLAQATLRDVVGRLSLDELLSQQERLESEIARTVDATSRSWGLHIEAIKIEDIDVPEELKKMMSRQASSEREKRATIIKADGDRQAASALSEAASVMAASPGAMQLRVLQTLDGLGPSASNTVVLALPLEIIEMMRSYIGKNRPPSS